MHTGPLNTDVTVNSATIISRGIDYWCGEEGAQLEVLSWVQMMHERSTAQFCSRVLIPRVREERRCVWMDPNIKDIKNIHTWEWTDIFWESCEVTSSRITYFNCLTECHWSLLIDSEVWISRSYLQLVFCFLRYDGPKILLSYNVLYSVNHFKANKDVLPKQSVLFNTFLKVTTCFAVEKDTKTKQNSKSRI